MRMTKLGWAMMLATPIAGIFAGGAVSARDPTPQAQAARAPVAAAVLPHTQALFDSYVATDKMPGIVGAFGYGDLPTVFVAAGKLSDATDAPVADADSLWRVYSMTKPITAMAAMMLIEDGKMRLDQPVSDFIPAFKTMRVLVDPASSLASRPATRPITIRNLLTHTAGLGYSIITKGPLLHAYEQAGIVPFATNRAVEADLAPTRPKTLAAFADRVAKLPLIADPGTTWRYSIALDVMGRVIEVASGMPFDAFVQTRILTPLKMRSTYWQVPASEARRLATNYAFVGDRRVPLDAGARSVFLDRPSFPYGGAGLVMSARDYDRFLHMLQDHGSLDGVRVMKPATVALAMSDLLPKGVTFRGVGGTAAIPMGFGAGGSVTLADVPNGPGKGTYGWTGAAGTVAWVDPTRNVRGTIMVDYFPPEKWPVRAETVKALFQDLARYR